ncbi:methylated-DNA--[protein]-cysteine S-methyltransferase [Microbacterium sp.]|uniref:methylated-DNA--[protein]-cysteine S-methyltransferase n=1 Tax=Microbacterium sp. TaxID=51671 RepID=UPI0037361795
MTSAAYAVHPTPLGDVLLVTTDAGLAALEVLIGPVFAEVARFGMLLRTVLVEDAASGADVARQLDEYFAGERRQFDVTLDGRLASEFTRRVMSAVSDIPYGQTAGYAEVAIAAGVPGANRAVGSACGRTPWSIVVPAHRVVRSDGSLGEYGGRPEHKRLLLELERGHMTEAGPGV